LAVRSDSLGFKSIFTMLAEDEVKYYHMLGMIL
jgi:hypothetical protein